MPRKGCKVKMVLDTKGLRGQLLASNVVYSLPCDFAKELVEEGRAEEYIARPKKYVRLVSPEHKVTEMSWGEYLKLRRRERA